MLDNSSWKVMLALLSVAALALCVPLMLADEGSASKVVASGDLAYEIDESAGTAELQAPRTVIGISWSYPVM